MTTNHTELDDDSYDAGYVAALLQLRARITKENPKPTLGIQKVLKHIQDMLYRCPKCGGWCFEGALCNTCALIVDVKRLEKA